MDGIEPHVKADGPPSEGHEERVCRICRGEGTEEDPLFYPCKCRGSIKYIHQGCLEEWLERSGRDKSCDICHEKYKFTTVYLENTPDRAPFNLILKRILHYILKFLKYSLTIFGLVVGVGIQVPLFFEITRRFINFFVDSKTTHKDFFISLLYGDNKFEGNPYDFKNLFDVLSSTYIKSLTFLTFFIFAHLILFLEHDWVSRDPGFKKLINKNIGRNSNINEAFIRNNEAVRQLINNGDIEALVNLVARENDADLQNQELRRRLIRQRAINVANALNGLENNDNLLHEDENSDEDPDFLPENNDDSTDDELNEADDEIDDDGEFPHPLNQPRIRIQHIDNNNNDDDLIRRNLNQHQAILNALHDAPRQNLNQHEAILNALNIARENENNHLEALRLHNERIDEEINELNEINEVPDIPNIPNPNRDQERNDPLPPFPFPIRQGPGQRQNQQPQQQPVANFLNNNRNEEQDPVAVDGLLDNLPVHIIIVAADILLAVYLTLAYLGPYLIGGITFHFLAFIFEYLNSFSVNLLIKFKIFPYLIQIFNGLNYIKNFNSDFNFFLDNYLIDPFKTSLSKIYNQNEPLTSNDRLIPLGLFYGLLYFGILKYLSIKSKKHNDRNPLKGIQRKVYILLFDLVCTLKVFLIFGTELIIFPAFAGLLVEFVLSPFVHPDAKLVLNTIPLISNHILIRIGVNWAIGTNYMCLFALYVGMTRRYILRPGVLFFIRSPEDPNARLVHDALVRPLSLQLSRIGLSGFVYTLFILIGFGVVSYGLRVIKSPLIPFDLNDYSISQLPYNHYALFSAYENIDILKKYIRQYWSRAFKSACTQTRLSSFILGNPNPKERGYIVYKSFFARFKKNVRPNYSEPKLYSEAIELFKDPLNKEEAFFIPDGNLIRAPKSDIVSRKFVKSLFISVTKDDIPLKSKKQLEEDFKKFKIDEFDESEDELTTTNQYEIVYRPPLFGFRIIIFILMLWIFSVILIAGVCLVANFIGKPFVFLHFYPLRYQLQHSNSKGIFSFLVKLVYSFDSPKVENYFTLRVNTAAVSIGLFIMLKLLKKYDSYLIKKHLKEEGDEIIFDDENNISKIIKKLKNFLPIFGALFLRMVTSTYYVMWNYLIHSYAINRPYNYYFGIDKDAIQYQGIYSDEPMFFTLNSCTILIHLVVFIQNNYYVLKNRLMTEDFQLVVNGDGNLLRSSLKFFKYVLKQFASIHLIVILFKISLSFYEYFKNGMDYNSYKEVLSNVVYERIYLEQQIYIWPAVLISVLIFKNYRNLSKFLKRVNNEVKEQYYSKGKTLENTEI